MKSMKHIVHPTDFELKRFASEPQIKRPICMNWDERGRLWIAESVDYPNNLQPDGQGNDRIVICEDTDGDGVADKFTVFADKLSSRPASPSPTAASSSRRPRTRCSCKSTKGDDKADERKILFTGWGTGDTHAGPSNLHYGFDNWIYGIVGYSGFNGTVGGETPQVRPGLLPLQDAIRAGSASEGRRHKLEFLRSTNNNSWGVGFSEEGLLFGSTANGNPERLHADPEPLLRKGARHVARRCCRPSPTSNKFYPITDKVRQVDFHGGFTAAAGHALYTARTYPKEYWNRVAFVTEPTGHLVATFVLDKKGTSFSSKQFLEPAGQRRRMVRPDHGRGRPGRQRLGHRLVQLHRPAQPDAARLQDRQGQRLRDAAPRQDAWPHLPPGDEGRRRAEGRKDPVSGPEHAGETGRGAQERQSLLAAACAAVAGRARQEGCRAGAGQADRRHDRWTRSA